MTDQSKHHHGFTLLLTVAAIVIIIYGINQAQSVIALFLFSVFLALIGTTPVLWLEKKHVPPFIAVMIVMVGIVISLLAIGIVVGESLSGFSERMPFYQKRLQEAMLSLKPLLASKQIIVTNNTLLEYVNPGPVLDIAVGLASSVGIALTNLLLVLLTVTFILLEASSFPVKLRAVLGNPHQDFPQFTAFISNLEQYMVIKTLISLATGALVAVWLLILGVDSPFLWGFIAFLFNFIPNVGSSIAAVPPTIIAFAQFGYGRAALVVAGYMTVNFVLDNIIETKLMGHKLGLSTLVVFLSLMFWGSLLGPIGMVLCIPFTMTLKFACENSDSTKWIAVILGSEDITEETLHLPKVKKKKD